jgi:hypothetical protein
MQKQRIRQRWMSLPWGILTLLIFLVFLAVGVISATDYPNERPSVRMVIPAFALYGYVVLALLVNWRTSVITPHGLAVSVWPLVVRPPGRLPRQKIRCCYYRNVSTYDEGTLLESYFSAGVESWDGRRIEISAPHETAAQAMEVAHQAAAVLNLAPGQSPIPVEEIDQLPGMAEIRFVILLMGFWLALFLAAIGLGAAWESQSAAAGHSDASQNSTDQSAIAENTETVPFPVERVFAKHVRGNRHPSG